MGIEVQLLIASFFAGMLTILAPCVIPVLPIIIAGSADDKKSKLKPVTITISLMVSIFVFSILLRASTVLIDVPPSFWTTISGVILVVFGLVTIFPSAWDWVSLKLNLSTRSNKLLNKSRSKQGFYGDVLAGAALGPVFASCSPTYAIIVGIAITGSLASAAVYLLFYTIGLGIVMLAIAVAGQKLIRHLGWATDPHGWFKRVVGITFIIVGLMILTGFDKTLAAWVIEGGFYDWIIQLESQLNGGMGQA